MKQILKKNIKLIVGIIIGIIFAGTSAYAAASINSNDVAYSNTKSGLESTDVKSAIDELAEKSDIRNYDNIVSAYTYNQWGDEKTRCISGEESTCVKTDCYTSTKSGSCPAGTIIKYKVNDTDIVTFHVVADNGSTMTMQSQKNIIEGVEWISARDYTIVANRESITCNSTYGPEYGCNNIGPYTAFNALVNATHSWTNVNLTSYSNYIDYCDFDQTYGMCYSDKYTEISFDYDYIRARMLTTDEAVQVGCTTKSSENCPLWVYNYLYGAENTEGGTQADYGDVWTTNFVHDTTNEINQGYWFMNPSMSDEYYATYIDGDGNIEETEINAEYSTINSYGVRAVVEINK